MAPVFPVADGTFSNTFRWPLAWDNGNDIMAPKGAPAVAVYDGTLAKVGNDGGKGGNRLWITNTGHGNFYYAHLNGYAPGIKDGVKVKAGQLLGYVGNSGNAYKGGGGAPHLHFGWSPSFGTVWRDPFALLKAAKGGTAPADLPANAIASKDTNTTPPAGSSLGGIPGYIDQTIVQPFKLHAQFYALILLGLVLVVVAFREPIIEAGTKAAKTAAKAAI